MAYQKQTFTAGQTLTAAHMNHIEGGLETLDVNKQEKLVSGTSIKTVNGQSLLGSGNIVVEGGEGGSVSAASYWNGKHLVWNGDSISYGSWLVNPTSEAYPYQVANALGMSINNYAIGGSYASKPEGSFDEYYWDYEQWQADVAAGKVDTSKKYLVKDFNDQAKPCRVYAYSNGKWSATSATGGWALVERVDEHIALHPDADLTVIAIGTNDFYVNQAFGSVTEANYRSLASVEGDPINLVKQGVMYDYGYRLASIEPYHKPYLPPEDASTYDLTLFSVENVPIKPNTQYKANFGTLRVWFLDADKNPISTDVLSDEKGQITLYKGFTTPENAYFMNMCFKDTAAYNNPKPSTVYLYEVGGATDNTEKIERISKSTFCGAIHTICRKLLNAYKGKNKDFVFVTPIKRYQTNSWDCKYPEDKNGKGKTLKDHVDAIIEICGYYSIPVVDLYRISGLNPHIDTSLFADTDGKAVHPNLEGHKRMASFVTAFLEGLKK